LLISGRETFIIPFPNLIYGIGGSPSPPVREKPYIIFMCGFFPFRKKIVNPEFYYRFLKSISYAKYTKKCGKAFLQFSQNYENKKEIY